jgi:hypothetical protein
VTLRCVREDLELNIASVDVDLGALDHPLIAEERRVASTAPRGQTRILAIEHPLVYRLRHGRWRGATWLETDELASGSVPARHERKRPQRCLRARHRIALHDAGRCALRFIRALSDR